MNSKSIIRILILLFCKFLSSNCLYDDQVGKFDWRQKYIGQLHDVVLPFKILSSNPHNSFILSTDSQVIASLFIRNGSIEWRHRLESSIDAIAAADDGSNGCDFMTINSNGKWIRCWSKSGVLALETSLPKDLLEEFEKEKNAFSKYFINANKESKEVVIGRFLWEKKQIEVIKFNILTNTLSKSSFSAFWLTNTTSCDFITSNYLICVDSNDLLIQFLPLNQNTFTTIPLSSFGLKAENKPKFLKITKLPYQDFSQMPYFSVDLGGDGFVLLRVQQNQVKFVKIFPKITSLTITPSEEVNKFIIWVLIVKENPQIPKDDSNVVSGAETETETETETGTGTGIKLAAFELDSWVEVKSLSGQFLVNSNLFVNDMYIIPFVRGDSKFYYKLFLSTEDGVLIMSNLQGKVTWKREESLASIISAEILDLPLSELDAQIEQTFNLAHANILLAFVNRISAQIYQFQTFFSNIISSFVLALSHKNTKVSRESEDEFGDTSLSSLSSLSRDVEIMSLVRDKFGLHKIIVTLSKTGKLFGIDTKSGTVVWSIYERQLASQDDKLPIFVQRTTAHYPYLAQSTVISKNGFLLSFDPITGGILEKIKFNTKIIQAMLLSHHDIQYLKPILIIDQNLNPIIYPTSAKSLFLTHKHLYFMLLAYKVNGSLIGLSFDESNEDNLKSRKVWTLDLPNTLINYQVIFKRFNERVHSQGRVMGDRNVLYKYLNPNLVVVVTESLTQNDPQEKTFLNVYLIDAITGAIIFSTIHKRAKGPVHVVHSENWIIYSYYNEKSRRTEISSIELFEGTTQSNTTAFSSLTRVDLTPAIIEHQTFIFPTGIDVMTDTITERGITNKHILIVLPSGALLELPKAFLDPRRPINPTAEHREEGLIPYIPELPIPSEGIINYNQSLTAIVGIQTAVTNLESTCLVFAFGLDLFYTRVTPSKTFDILKDDFDHLFISAVLIGIVVFSYIAKWLSAKKSLKSLWK